MNLLTYYCYVALFAGVVLGRSGGMIKQLYLPFFMGLGGPVASGSQYMPWIHIEDMCNLLLFAIEHPEVSGVLNGVAPMVCKRLSTCSTCYFMLGGSCLLSIVERRLSETIGAGMYSDNQTF